MNYRWTKEEQNKLPIKKYTYGTTFSGAGGTSMGLEYLNRFTNIFFNELDNKQIELYKRNLNPLYGFEIPIQELIKLDLTDKPEMFDLDILQASPPCSLYSGANLKADKMKGQDSSKFHCDEDAGMCQIIDELYQPAIELCGKLQPKVFIIENVTGLLFKKNKVYVDDIYKLLNDLNYKVMHSIVRGEDIGLPQQRNRVFFIAIREDLDFNYFTLDFDEPKVKISDIEYTDTQKSPVTERKLEILENYTEADTNLGDITLRTEGRKSMFNCKILERDKHLFNTITTKSGSTLLKDIIDGELVFSNPTEQQLIQAQSFPLDYDFNNRSPYYALGMSVAPLMIAKIVERVEKHILEPFYK